MAPPEVVPSVGVVMPTPGKLYRADVTDPAAVQKASQLDHSTITTCSAIKFLFWRLQAWILVMHGVIRLALSCGQQLGGHSSDHAFSSMNPTDVGILKLLDYLCWCLGSALQIERCRRGTMHEGNASVILCGASSRGHTALDVLCSLQAPLRCCAWRSCLLRTRQSRSEAHHIHPWSRRHSRGWL